jgi:hypothetical protein
MLNEWMHDPDLGEVRLMGEDCQIWTNQPPSELLALDRRDCDDPLSSWMTSFVTSWFHRTVGKYFKVYIYELLFVSSSPVTRRC